MAIGYVKVFYCENKVHSSIEIFPHATVPTSFFSVINCYNAISKFNHPKYLQDIDNINYSLMLAT
jgi:hypothetical protein